MCAGVNRKQIVYSAVGCVVAENATEGKTAKIKSKNRDFFAWTMASWDCYIEGA